MTDRRPSARIRSLVATVSEEAAATDDLDVWIETIEGALLQRSAPTEPARVLPSREQIADLFQEVMGGWQARYWTVIDRVLALFAAQPTAEQVKAEALREHRRRVVRFMPTGLVNRATVLADLDDYADRLAPAQSVPDVPEVDQIDAELGGERV